MTMIIDKPKDKKTVLKIQKEHPEITIQDMSIIHPSELQSVAAEAAQALKLVAAETAEAARELASAAAQALKVQSMKNSEDHDALIAIRIQLDTVISTMKEIQSGTSSKIEDLYKVKVDNLEFAEMKKCCEKDALKIRILENKTQGYWIAFSLYTLALGAALWILIAHISHVVV